jgi:ABC-2 type transport system ATP-binding protein
VDLDPRQKAGKLSGGQRAQLALTLAIAKRPELLFLDEPIASLDPLARREFLQILMESTADQELSVVMSSHLVADLERVCDYLIVLVASRVQVAGPVDELLASHHILTGPRRDASALPPGQHVITDSHTGRPSTFVVRSSGPVDDATLSADSIDLEDLVLAYMGAPGRPGRRSAAGDDLARLASVPRPGHHGRRDPCRPRDPAGCYRTTPGVRLQLCGAERLPC